MLILDPPLSAGAVNAMVRVWLVELIPVIVGAPGTVAAGVAAEAELATPVLFEFFPLNFT